MVKISENEVNPNETQPIKDLSTTRILFVVQRYGTEIVGGSEALARMVAEQLAPYLQVEVATTCAQDHYTWMNKYPQGDTLINGVLIHRFPTDMQRQPNFHNLLDEILQGQPVMNYPLNKLAIQRAAEESRVEDQLTCLAYQGPYSNDLLNFIKERGAEYDLLFFFAYPYAPTFFGLLEAPVGKRILIPTAHDEAFINLPIFKEMFARADGFIFLTPEERNFVDQRFQIGNRPETTIGIGIVPTETGLNNEKGNETKNEKESNPKPPEEKNRALLDLRSPVALYAGRIEEAKNCHVLLKYWAQYAKETELPVRLVLMGSLNMPLTENQNIVYLGSLSEYEKQKVLRSVDFLIQPSQFESFSIIMIEALAAGIPVLANGESEVLCGHAKRSNAALYYTNYAEFAFCAELLFRQPDLRACLARAGPVYIEQNYTWPLITRQYREFITKLLS